MILPARQQKMGNVEIHRALPRRERRRVGPFVFLDEMGPLDDLMTVAPHPHIGLSTVTYLFSGEILHLDSLGSEQVIRPGDVNLMVAGRGIVHSERMLESGGKLRGLQFWMALRKDDEECAPSFQHFPGAQFPAMQRTGLKGRLIMGELEGKCSPIADPAKPFFTDWRAEAGAELEIPFEGRELCAYLVSGDLEVVGAERPLVAGDLFIPESGDSLVLRAKTESVFAVFGGEPLDGDRFMWWNFVSSSKERLEIAKSDWKAGRFGDVPRETLKPIPLPES